MCTSTLEFMRHTWKQPENNLMQGPKIKNRIGKKRISNILNGWAMLPKPIYLQLIGHNELLFIKI